MTRKTDAQKRRRGTYRPSNSTEGKGTVLELITGDDPPDMPQDLAELIERWSPRKAKSATAFWDRVCRLLMRNNQLAREKLDLIAHLTAVHAELWNRHEHGGRSQSAAVWVEYRRLHDAVGLTGSTPTTKPEDNPFSCFG
ncbi:MAG: hypothetical protein AAGE01_15415 [Pseudomonadota bacterium]